MFTHDDLVFYYLYSEPGKTEKKEIEACFEFMTSAEILALKPGDFVWAPEWADIDNPSDKIQGDGMRCHMVTKTGFEDGMVVIHRGEDEVETREGFVVSYDGGCLVMTTFHTMKKLVDPEKLLAILERHPHLRGRYPESRF